MNKIIYCPSPLPKKKDYWVFLAGPIQGAPEWQKEIERMPEIPGVTFLSPRRMENPKGNEDSTNVFSEEDYKEQVDWETSGLRYCDGILFWIPLSVEDIPGRQYAQTTRFELGENLARGKKVWLGADPLIPGRRYFQKKIEQYNQKGVFETLEDCLKEIKEEIDKKKNNPKIFFTSDTHFGHTRALQFSLRPFQSVEEMNEKIIENWNREVSPWDSVYHLGDFGNMDFLKYLNGQKILILGNYEEEEIKTYGITKEEYINVLINDLGFNRVIKSWECVCLEKDKLNFVISHCPLKVKEIIERSKTLGGQRDEIGLFGHTHGRQMIKPWGIDVGVDCNNFTPVSIEKIKFLKEAIKTGKYDEEVWS